MSDHYPIELELQLFSSTSAASDKSGKSWKFFAVASSVAFVMSFRG